MFGQRCFQKHRLPVGQVTLNMAVGSYKWLMLIYSVPRHPSASRLYVWRKLKRLGAIMLQDAVWVLPLTHRTRVNADNA